MTQHNLILDYIKKHKTITPFEAYDKLGCTKLATRISELRAKGIKIQDEEKRKALDAVFE